MSYRGGIPPAIAAAEWAYDSHGASIDAEGPVALVEWGFLLSLTVCVRWSRHLCLSRVIGVCSGPYTASLSCYTGNNRI